MHRRELLRTAGLAFAAGACPMWIQRAFAQEPGKRRKRGTLELALARAEAVGKPLLVVAIPERNIERYRRQELLSALLRCDSDELLASLALVEVVCAPIDEVRALDDTLDTTALAFFVEQKPQLRIVGVTVDLESPPVVKGLTENDENEANRRWLAPLIERLRNAIVGDAAQVQRLVSVNDAKLDDVMRSTVRRDLRTSRVARIERVDQCAAQFYAASLASDAARNLWQPLLVKAASARLLDFDPAGASWASSGGGCGAGPCGTGFVGARSRRFLHFLTDGG